MYSNETRIYIAILSGVLVLLLLVVVFTITIIKYHRKKLAYQEKKVGCQVSYLDQQCEKIAADLHDDLGSSLSGIKVRLQSLNPRDANTLAIVNFSKDHIDEVMRRLKLIAFNMVPDLFLQNGLPHALQELANVMTFATDIRADFDYNAPDFDKERATHLYRIVQELLNNTLKHSGASALSCKVQQHKKNVQVHFTDNGKGFNKDALAQQARGVGLKNIRSRTDLLGAKLYVTTAPAKGVDYLIEIPVV